MSQSRSLVEPLQRATNIVIAVETHLTIKLGTELRVKVESDKPIEVLRRRLGKQLIVTDDIPDYYHGIMASSFGAASQPVHGTIVTVPKGIEVIIEIANELTIDPATRAAIHVTDNR